MFIFNNLCYLNKKVKIISKVTILIIINTLYLTNFTEPCFSYNEFSKVIM